MKKQKNYVTVFTENEKEAYKFYNVDIANIRKTLQNGVCGKISSNEELNELMDKYGTFNICKKVIGIIKKIFNVDLGDISFTTGMTRLSLSASAKYRDKKLKVVDIDALLIDELHGFFVLVFLWNNIIYFKEAGEKCYENGVSFERLYDLYFKYLFTKNYAVIQDKKRCNIYLFEQVKYEYDKIGEKNIFNVSVCCEYCSAYFLVAHECAHIYFERCGKVFDDTDEFTKEEIEEFEADKFAFDVIKYIITFDEMNSECIEEERVLYPYTYQSPIMLLAFYHVYFTTYYYLKYDKTSIDLRNAVEKRIKKLREYIQSTNYEFETSAGRGVADSVEDTIAIFYEMLGDYKQDGRLDQIIDFLDKC